MGFYLRTALPQARHVDYPGCFKYADSDDAPDANEVYRRVLAAYHAHVRDGGSLSLVDFL